MRVSATDRSLPASVEAERSILGSILLDNKAYNEAAGTLRPEDFSLDSHRRIYLRMAELVNSLCPVDLVTLVAELENRNELQAVGDASYISALLDGVPDRPSIEHYVRIVKEKALRRGLIHAAENTINACHEATQSVDELLTSSEAKIRVLAERHARAAGASRISCWVQIPTLERLPVGDVSWVVEGMVPASSIVLWAGESGSYKTWLSLWLAKAVQEGRDFLGRKTVHRPVLYLDRENPLALIQERCSLLGIRSSEDFRIWGGWQSDGPPLIGDRRLLEIACMMKPLIVFDSFIRFHGADENSATEMARVMADVRALTNAGAVVNLQHHKPKAEGTHYRGSSDIKSGVDVAFAVTYGKEQEFLNLQCFKNRFGEELAVTVKPRLDEGLGFEVTRDPSIQREHDEEEVLLRIVQEEPGIGQSQIVKLSGLPVHKTRSILKRREGTLWRAEQGPRGRLDYHPLRTDSTFSAFQPYSPEKLKSSTEKLRVIEGEL